DVIDLRDVGMVERGGDPGLVEEHLNELWLARQLGQQALDHDPFFEAFEPAYAGEVDLGHAARRQVFQQLVLAEPRKRAQARRLGPGWRRSCGYHAGFYFSMV